MCHPIHRPQPHQPISFTMASSSPSSSLLTCASRAALNPVKVTPDLLSNVLRNAVHMFWHDQRRSDSAHNMIAGVWSTKIWPGTLLAPYTVTFLFDHSVGGNWVRPLPQPHVTEITFRAVWWRDTEEVPFTTAALPVALQVIPRKHGLLEQLTFDKCKFHDGEQLFALSVTLAKPESITNGAAGGVPRGCHVRCCRRACEVAGRLCRACEAPWVSGRACEAPES